MNFAMRMEGRPRQRTRFAQIATSTRTAELVFYCPEAEREFGESVSAAFGLTSSSSLTGHRTLDLGCDAPFRSGLRLAQPHG